MRQHRSHLWLCAALLTGLVTQAACGEGAAEVGQLDRGLKPEHSSGHFTYTFVDHTCSFDTSYLVDFDLDQKLFFNRAGQPIRSRAHYHGTTTITNVDNGRAVADDFNFLYTIDLVEGTLITTGVRFTLKVGNRTLYKQVGRIVFRPPVVDPANVVFVAGRDENPSDEEFCALLQAP